VRDPVLVLTVVAAMTGAGLALVAHGITVYHGWLFDSHPWVVRVRRRTYWHFMRTGVPSAWGIPGTLSLGISLLSLSLGTWLLSSDQSDGIGLAAALIGLLGMFASFVLAWLRPRWFLAGWHRMEVERERAGLEPLLPPPSDGPTMSMTRREYTTGLALVGMLFIVWWVFALPPAVLISAATLLGILGIARKV
jgi:hypothetical protein